MRVGRGHDTHRLVVGGPLRLGGVDIPHDFHLHGHSDADVLLHAVTDALLGAAALGDIGELFPDTADENKNRDSADMLALVQSKIVRAGYRIVNMDCTVSAQAPKLSPYKRMIANQLAQILEIEPSQVSVKAKTGEAVGPVGRGEAIEADCVVLIVASPEKRI